MINEWGCERYKLCAVEECCFDLHVRDHRIYSFHDIGDLEQGRAVAHKLGDGFAVARTFHDLVGDDGDGLGIIELKSTRLSAAGQISGGYNEKFFAFAGSQMHAVEPEGLSTNGGG